MATGANLVTGMTYLDNDIDATADATQALYELNRAQDMIELVIAGVPNILGTFATVTTSADTETSATPARFLRYDRLQFIDPDTSRPAWELSPVRHPGDVLIASRFAAGYLGSGSSGSTGRPRAYTLYGDTIQWTPLPDATHTVRVYGFQALVDITDSGTFGYGDEFISVVTAIAVRAFKQQVDDPQKDIMAFAGSAMAPILDQLRKRWKDGYGQARDRRIHTT